MVEYVDSVSINSDTIVYRRAGGQKGVWHYRIAMGGAYIRKSTKTTDLDTAKAVANAAWLDAIDRHRTGRPVAVRTVGDAARSFVKEWDKSSTPKSRRWAYVNQSNKYIIPHLGVVPLDLIGRREIDRFIKVLEGNNLSSSTINNYLTTLSKVLEHAVDNDMLDERDLPRIKRKSTKMQQRRLPFTDVELNVITQELAVRIDGATKHRKKFWRELYYYFILLRATGLRPSSVSRMVAGDVFLDSDNTLMIHAITEKGGERRERDIVVNSGIAANILEFARARDDAAPLFTYSTSWFNKKFCEVVRDSDAISKSRQRRTIYSIRHSYITKARVLDVSVADVAANTLTSVQMIQRHYDHSTGKDVRKRLSNLGSS